MNERGPILQAGVNGDYSSGVANNTGFIGISGKLTAPGHHRFTDVSNAGAEPSIGVLSALMPLTANITGSTVPVCSRSEGRG